MGDQARALMPRGSKLIWTVEAESHFDAMTKYYAFMGWGAYAADDATVHAPYPEEWVSTQRSAGNRDV